jgi:hypothetical protein
MRFLWDPGEARCRPISKRERESGDWNPTEVEWNSRRGPAGDRAGRRRARLASRGRMSTYRVAFDGKWHGDFDSLPDSLEWAQEVSLTERMASVVERRALVHVFRAGWGVPKKYASPGTTGVGIASGRRATPSAVLRSSAAGGQSCGLPE